MDRSGFVEDDKISLKKINEYIEKESLIKDSAWLDNFRKAGELCIKKGKLSVKSRCYCKILTVK